MTNRLSPSSFPSIFVAGFFWGLAGFGLVLVDQFAISDSSFRLVCFLLGTGFAAQHVTVFRNTDGFLILLFILYVSFLFISSISTVASLANGFRELLLLLVVTFVCAISNNENAFSNFLKGILTSLFLMILYLFFQIEFSVLLSPYYRLDAGVGSNAVGFYAVIAFFYAAAQTFRSTNHSTLQYVFVSLAIISSTVLIACKSRTALGSLVLMYALIAVWKKPQLAVYMFIVGAATLVFGSDLIDNVFRISPLVETSSERNISNFTGRTWVWVEGLSLFSEKPLLGHGMIFSAAEDSASTNFHNAFIQMLAISGIFGALPILVIILAAIIGFIKSLKKRKNVPSLETDGLMIFSFGVGLIGAFLENRLLNFGNPASLIFLISILTFAKKGFVKQRRKTRDRQHNCVPPQDQYKRRGTL